MVLPRGHRADGPHWAKMMFIHSIMNQHECSVNVWIVWVDWSIARNEKQLPSTVTTHIYIDGG